MKISGWLFGGLAVGFFACPAGAEDLQFNWGGKVQTDLRFRMIEKSVGDYYQKLTLPQGVSRNENIFKLKLDVSTGPYAAVADIDVVWRGYPEALNEVGDLSLREKLDPVYLEAHSLYVEAGDFILEGMDLRVGQQKVLWGVGDQFNPTNTINPNDIEDVLLFGEQSSNLMVRLDYQFVEMWTLSGVLVPVFKPALLPESGKLGTAAVDRLPFLSESLRHRLYVEKAYVNQANVPQANYGGYPTVVDRAKPELPEVSFENMQFAFRLAGTVFEQDVALSYYRGRTDLPQPTRNYTRQKIGAICNPANPEECVNGLLQTEVSLGYPKMQVVGFNMAGEIPLSWMAEGILPIGYRLELGVFFPESQEITLLQDEISLGGITQPAGEYDYRLGGRRPLTLDSVPFYKWVVGLDYSFGSHVYLNVMWVHGMADDFGIGWAVRQGGSDVSATDAVSCIVLNDYGRCSSREILRPRLGDYLVLGVDLKFLEERLLFRLFTIWDLIGVYTGEWDPETNTRIKEHRGMFTSDGFSAVIFPELKYNFGGGLELGLGALLMLGQDYSKFGDPAAGGSLVWTRARYSF